MAVQLDTISRESLAAFIEDQRTIFDFERLFDAVIELQAGVAALQADVAEIQAANLGATTADVGPIADVTVVQSFGTLTGVSPIPADLAVGDVIVVRGSILLAAVGANANQGLRLAVRFGSVDVVDFGTDVFFAATVAMTNGAANFEIRSHVRVAGASGALRSDGDLQIGRGPYVGERGTAKMATGTANVAVDLSVTNAITVRGAFYVNTAGSDTMTLTNVRAWVERKDV